MGRTCSASKMLCSEVESFKKTWAPAGPFLSLCFVTRQWQLYGTSMFMKRKKSVHVTPHHIWSQGVPLRHPLPAMSRNCCKNILSKQNINKACGLCCNHQHSPNSNVLICIMRTEMTRTLFNATYKWNSLSKDKSQCKCVSKSHQYISMREVLWLFFTNTGLLVIQQH